MIRRVMLTNGNFDTQKSRLKVGLIHYHTLLYVLLQTLKELEIIVVILNLAHVKAKASINNVRRCGLLV